MPIAAHQKLEHLQTLFEGLPDGVVAISAGKSQRILNINAAARDLLNVQAGTVVNRRIDTIFTGELLPLLQVVQESLEQERAVKNFTVELQTKGNQTRNLLVTTSLITTDHRTLSSVLLVLHDVSESTQLGKDLSGSQKFEALVGATEAMKDVFSVIETVAPTNADVLINGETGTGKELVARAIHERSNRSNRPFIPVHCSALTSSLLESDLFGHVRGAFTGAIKDRPGRFELADGGTIFLDEIATLSQEIQVNLLRVLQEKTIERVGGTKATRVNVRIISATNRLLPELIRLGAFRKDLYYRIKVIQINLPPLRKRKLDIPLLVRHFIDRFNREHGRNILGVSDHSMKILLSYSWPGNVRELQHAIEQTVILSQSNMIEPSSLPEELRHTIKSKHGAHLDLTPQLSEAEEIRRALKETAGNVTRAADKLGIHRTTLWRKMREMKIPKDF